ncbi:MAG: sulfur carrier protein ThiS [Muribaculaceae bacterium]|nr:sulfur carrier protein ThiS [Muribaculaceae bacterium]MDE7343822.1 sulfur carrier protein ThiS [Muribaculaceae bacterium]
MHISVIINGQHMDLPEEVKSVAQLLEWRHIPVSGTAVALNSRLVTAAQHAATMLNHGDVITIISAAYGG